MSTIEARRTTAADQPAVLALLADSLGWDRDPAFADFFEWKHLQNPFGPSPAWVAVHEGAIVGFRTFLRWQFDHPDGRVRQAVRAVDTATAPEFQGRGIFRQLTMAAVEELTAERVWRSKKSLIGETANSAACTFALAVNSVATAARTVKKKWQRFLLNRHILG